MERCYICDEKCHSDMCDDCAYIVAAIVENEVIFELQMLDIR